MTVQGRHETSEQAAEVHRRLRNAIWLLIGLTPFLLVLLYLLATHTPARG